MNLSDVGAKLLIAREAKMNKAYKDSKGIWTIGVGHTGPEVHEGLVWTDSQVMGAFRTDVKWAEDAVNAVAGLSQNQFDALVSFTFNVGVKRVNKSTMKKRMDAGDMDVASEFDKWHKPPEITSRRNGERDQFRGIAFEARR